MLGVDRVLRCCRSVSGSSSPVEHSARQLDAPRRPVGRGARRRSQEGDHSQALSRSKANRIHCTPIHLSMRPEVNVTLHYIFLYFILNFLFEVHCQYIKMILF